MNSEQTNNKTKTKIKKEPALNIVISQLFNTAYIPIQTSSMITMPKTCNLHKIEEHIILLLKIETSIKYML
jgi:hypothetical protein